MQQMIFDVIYLMLFVKFQVIYDVYKEWICIIIFKQHSIISMSYVNLDNLNTTVHVIEHDLHIDVTNIICIILFKSECNF